MKFLRQPLTAYMRMTLVILSVTVGHSSIFCMNDAISRIAAKTEWRHQIGDITELIQVNASTSVDAASQQKLIDLITTVFNRRIDHYKAVAAGSTLLNLAGLNTLLMSAGQSPIFKDEQQKTILGFQKLANTEQLVLENQAGSDFTTQLDNLGAALRGIGSNPTDQFIQNIFFQELNSAYKARGSEDNALQTELNVLLKLATTSPLLNTEQQQQVSQQMVPALTLQLALALTDPNARAAALQDFLTNNPNVTLNPEEQTALQNGLQALVNNPPNDPALLENLVKTLGGLGNSNLLSSDFRAQVSSTILPAVQTALSGATTAAALKTALSNTEPLARINALQQFIANNSKATLSAEEQAELQNGIQGIVNNLPTDASSLAQMLRAVGLLNGSPLLSRELQSQLSSAILPTITTSLNEAKINAALKQALSISDPILRMAAIQGFIKDHPGIALSPTMQEELQSALFALTNNPPSDPAVISNLMQILGSLSGNSLLSADFQAQLTNSLLPELSVDLANANINAALQAALAITDPLARMAALQKFMDDNGSTVLMPAIQAALQGGLQALTNPMPKDPVVLKSLSALLSGLNTSSLIDAGFKSQLTSTLQPSVNKALNIADMNAALQVALAIQDPTARMEALKQFVSNNAGTDLPADLQKELEKGLSSLAKELPAGPEALSKLSTMLGGMSNSKLLSPEFKKEISKSILPKVKTAQKEAQNTAQILATTQSSFTKAQARAKETLVALDNAQEAIKNAATADQAQSAAQLKKAEEEAKKAVAAAKITQKAAADALKELTKAEKAKKSKKTKSKKDKKTKGKAEAKSASKKKDKQDKKAEGKGKGKKKKDDSVKKEGKQQKKDKAKKTGKSKKSKKKKDVTK